MREVAEFRVLEEFAPLLFADDEGERLGAMVRRIRVDTSDPVYGKIGALQRQLRAERGKSFFLGWTVTRKPSAAEFRAARLFHLLPTKFFEPAGEESGTLYDDTAACLRCGAGAPQRGPLILPGRRLPRSGDLVQTIAGETIISLRLRRLLETHRATGIRIDPIRVSRTNTTEAGGWFQLSVTAIGVAMVPPTRTGSGLFDTEADDPGACERGDLLGLNLLSAITVDGTTLPDADFSATQQLLGVRRGLLRPWRPILVSPRIAAMFRAEAVKGVALEVAYPVP